jgi:hypothetical protein
MDELVARALAREGLHVRAFERISAFGAGLTERHAYRVTLADGRTVKARRTLGESQARRVVEALRAVADARFPRVLSRHGPVLLEEWIDGVPLTSAAVEDRHLAEAAAVLAEVHLVEALAGVPVREWGDTAARLAATETRLQRLAGAGALDEASRTVLASALRDHDPRRAEIGLVHLDFCPENLVIDREGRLRVVDNEALAVDALAYDLGRSWYRSALPPARWALFEAAYRRHGGPAASAGSTVFWRIAAVTEGAITRLERDSRGAQPSLDRLGQLAAELRRSAAAPPAART